MKTFKFNGEYREIDQEEFSFTNDKRTISSWEPGEGGGMVVRYFTPIDQKDRDQELGQAVREYLHGRNWSAVSSALGEAGLPGLAKAIAPAGAAAPLGDDVDYAGAVGGPACGCA